jgi:gentisate 1,2-dioxygenase
VGTTRFRSDDPDLDVLYADVADADLQPLWQQKGLLPRVPNGLSAHLWPWKSLRGLAERCGGLVGIDRGGDRRVLALSHPDLGGLPFATHTLWAGIQYLGGHELAPAHRHSPAALRFVLEGSGVWTLVNGDPVAMEPGDLVLTPSYTWHEHHNRGDDPMIWFDGLDLPLIRNLDAVFFEEGPDELSPYEPVARSRGEQLHAAAGVLPIGGDAVSVLHPASGRHSQLIAYRWADVDRALAARLARADVAHAAVRYADPATGGDIMPTLRGEMHRFAPGLRTLTTRRVGSAVWVVYRGSGTTVIDGQPFVWEHGDIFVTPSWAAVAHRADSEADLFMVSDEPVIEAIGLARTQVEADGGAG